MKSWPDYLKEIEGRAEKAGIPWHIGHISRANENRMDVCSESGVVVAEDTLIEYASFACHASRDIPRMAKRIRELEEALKCLVREVEMGTVPVFKGSPNVDYARETLAQGVEE